MATIGPSGSPQILRARRRKAEVLEVWFGPCRFDPHSGLWRGHREVPLKPRAVGVLAALVASAGTVVSKQSLLETCWRDTFLTEASLLEAVRLLRHALDDDRLNPKYIQTVRRRGYRFIAEVTPAECSGADVRVLVRGSSELSPRQDLRVVLEWCAGLTRLVRLPV